MTHEEVKALVEEMGLPYAYDHFAEGESPDPPFICFLYPKAENFGADNLVYHHFNRLDIEVYTDYKDPDMARKSLLRQVPPCRACTASSLAVTFMK